MKHWRKYVKGVLGTLGAVGIWLAAVACLQPPVAPPSIPLWQCGVREWVITDDYQTSVALSGVTYTVIIHEGFRSDGASIPDSLASLSGIGRDHPAIIRGALIHDALYAAHLTDRSTADALLYAACLQDGMEPAKAIAVWRAVHEWGFVAWDRRAVSISDALKLVEIYITKK